MSEQRFEYRLTKILESKGYLVVNCARSKPFDLVAIKHQLAYPIEVKGRGTRYLDTQRREQRHRCEAAGSMFHVIRQSTRRGKFSLTTVPLTYLPTRLHHDLAEYLIDGEEVSP